MFFDIDIADFIRPQGTFFNPIGMIAIADTAVISTDDLALSQTLEILDITPRDIQRSDDDEQT